MSLAVLTYQIVILVTIFFAWRIAFLLGIAATLFWVIWTINFTWGDLQSLQSIVVVISTVIGYLSRKKKILSNPTNISDELDLEGLDNTEIETIEGPENHRNELIETLERAKHTVIIWSGFARNFSINDELIDLFKSALNRGVNIYVGYGYNTSRGEKASATVIEKLNKLREYGKEERSRGFFLIGVKDNHKKILVCDDEYIIVGSFNWLGNNKGNPNDEESYKITNRDRVVKESSKHKSDIIKSQ